MSTIVLEVLIIVGLVLVNGVFAMTELAFVSVRRGQLRRLAEQGDRAAARAVELAESPTRLLSTVQVGITLVGVLAGAFGGATIAEQIGRALQGVPWLERHGEAIGIGIVVLAISYLSLVLGELVPKRLALNNPAGIARAMAGSMHRLARLGSPAVRLLGWSTDTVLKLIGAGARPATTVTEEEVTVLVREGLRAGVFFPAESQMVESVLRLDRVIVSELMTPRPKIIWINVDDPHDAIWHKIVVSGHTRFPVYQGNRDRIVGVLSLKAVYANLAAGAPVRVRDLMAPPLIVPATQNALQLLDTFKKTGNHLALVTDEFGAIIGLVTVQDVAEAVLGDFPSLAERQQPAATRREDGSWLIDGLIGLDKVERALPDLRFPPDESRPYETLAGFVVQQLGHVPREGETFEFQGHVFEVLDMDQHRIDKILVGPPAPPPPGTAGT